MDIENNAKVQWLHHVHISDATQIEADIDVKDSRFASGDRVSLAPSPKLPLLIRQNGELKFNPIALAKAPRGLIDAVAKRFNIALESSVSDSPSDGGEGIGANSEQPSPTRKFIGNDTNVARTEPTVKNWLRLWFFTYDNEGNKISLAEAPYRIEYGGTLYEEGVSASDGHAYWEHLPKDTDYMILYGPPGGSDYPLSALRMVGKEYELEVASKFVRGSIKVVVKDICTGGALKNVETMVSKKTQKTNTNGEVSFKDVAIGNHNVKVEVHFKDADYSTFYVHYPRVLNNHKAISSDFGSGFVEANKETKIEFKLEVYKTVGDIVFHRRHIDIGGADKYGHWWVVVNAHTSYGWWPKYGIGTIQNQNSQPPTPPSPLPVNPNTIQKIQYDFEYAVYLSKLKVYELKESGPAQTFRGVEGELNGQTSFGGTATMDPHHMGGDAGDEQYQPVRWDCFNLNSIEADIASFANSYAGGWSWRFETGNHCHTFQKLLMEQHDLDNVKVVK